MKLACVQQRLRRRSLRGGAGLFSRRLLQECGAPWLVHEKWLPLPSLLCRFLSISTPQNGDIKWEEPFEEQTEAELEAETREGDGEEGRGSSPSVQARSLSRQLIRLDADVCVTPLLQQWLDEGNTLSKKIAIVSITNLKRHRRYKHALEVSNFVWKKQLFELDVTDHMYRLYLNGQVGSIEDVEKCFAEIPDKFASERVYSQLMSCYIARGMIVDAEATLEKLQKSGHLVSALPFTQFLSHYGRQQEYKKAFKLMEDMKAANITFDTRTYNAIICLSQKQGDTNKMLSLFKAMKDTGVAPDSFTYSLIIKAHMESGMEEEAQRLIEEMRTQNPDGRLLLENDLMLAVYADQGKEKELKKLWKHIQSSSNISSRSYGVMIESLGKLGLTQEAEDLAAKAERKRGRLVARIFNALLDVYARHGEMEAAEDLMLRVLKERLRPTTVTYRHLISGYLKINKVEKALEYLKTSRESLTYDHSKPWLASFLLVLDHLAERGKVELAEQTFETFTAAGPYRSTLVYNTLLKAYMRSNRCAEDFAQRMSNDGFLPDSDTTAMLSQMEAFKSV